MSKSHFYQIDALPPTSQESYDTIRVRPSNRARLRFILFQASSFLQEQSYSVILKQKETNLLSLLCADRGKPELISTFTVEAQENVVQQQQNSHLTTELLKRRGDKPVSPATGSPPSFWL